MPHRWRSPALYGAWRDGGKKGACALPRALFQAGEVIIMLRIVGPLQGHPIPLVIESARSVISHHN